MNWIIRRTLLITSGIFFIVAGPAVVLYAIGYRLQPSAQPTSIGVLIIETFPRRAQVFVNNELTGLSPESIAGLSAGKADVKVEREGYSTWQKRIDIEPNRATEFRDVRLFATELKPRHVQSSVATFSVSPSRQFVAAVDLQGTLNLFDTQGQIIGSSLSLAEVPANLLWSPDSTQMLISYPRGRWELVDIGDQGPLRVRLSQSAFSRAKDVTWDPRLPGRILILSSTGTLRSFSIPTQSSGILAEDVNVFAPSTRHIVIAKKDGSLEWYSLPGQLQHTRRLSASAIKELKVAPNGLIAATTEDNIVSIFRETGDVTTLSSATTMIGWSPDGTLILTQPQEGELAIYNVDNDRMPHHPIGTLKSIIRLSRPIHDPQWFAGGAHVLYQVGDEISISEIDSRDTPIQFSVDTTNTGNARATVGQSGELLYYLKQSSGITSLVARDLILPEE